MSEAATIIGLVASIASLVDLSTKVVSRLHNFTSDTSDIPDSFHALFTSLPCAQDTGGESPCIDTRDGLKASDCGRLGRQAAGYLWSALRVVKGCRSQSSSSAPKWYQSSLSKPSTRGGRGGEKKRRQSDWLLGDRQTDQNKADERWYPSRPCGVLNCGL